MTRTRTARAAAAPPPQQTPLPSQRRMTVMAQDPCVRQLVTIKP